jgi:hypothetical protein
MRSILIPAARSVAHTSAMPLASNLPAPCRSTTPTKPASRDERKLEKPDHVGGAQPYSAAPRDRSARPETTTRPRSRRKCSARAPRSTPASRAITVNLSVERKHVSPPFNCILPLTNRSVPNLRTCGARSISPRNSRPAIAAERCARVISEPAKYL